MLNDWTPAPRATPKPAPSLLDDWAVPVTKPASKEVPAKAAPSMLDQWTSLTPPSSKSATKQVPSMLDDWTAPVAKPKIEAPKPAAPSMLDRWTVPAQSTSEAKSSQSNKHEIQAPVPSEPTVKTSFLANPTMPTSMPNSADDDAKQDEMTSVRGDSNMQSSPKERAEDKTVANKLDPEKDADTDKKEEKKVEESYKMPKGLKQPPPEAFKEPDPNSLLDAFGF
jgi:hypothetical protein